MSMTRYDLQDFVHISENQGKSILHPRRNHVVLAMLCVGDMDNPDLRRHHRRRHHRRRRRRRRHHRRHHDDCDVGIIVVVTAVQDATSYSTCPGGSHFVVAVVGAIVVGVSFLAFVAVCVVVSKESVP